jgi:hypothetical protein
MSSPRPAVMYSVTGSGAAIPTMYWPSRLASPLSAAEVWSSTPPSKVTTV